MVTVGLPNGVGFVEACYAKTNEVYAETSAKNADFKKVHDHMMAFRGDQYFWWQVAEGTYDNFMIDTVNSSAKK